MRHLLTVALAAGFMLCAAAYVALAHDHGPGSWINHQNLHDPVTKEHCCNLNDCQEEPDNVRALGSGDYLILNTQEVFPAKRVIWRSPGGWWRCRYMIGPLAGKTRCLIGPPNGS